MKSNNQEKDCTAVSTNKPTEIAPDSGSNNGAIINEDDDNDNLDALEAPVDEDSEDSPLFDAEAAESDVKTMH